MADPGLYPLTFGSVFRDGVWAGRNLETVLTADEATIRAEAQAQVEALA